MPKEVLHPQNAQSLGTIAKRLHAAAEQIQGIADGLVDLGIETLQMTHYDAITKALKGAESFVGAARLAVNGALEDRGDFLGGSKAVSEKVSESRPRSPKRKTLGSKKGHTEHRPNGADTAANPLIIEDLRR